MSQRKHLKLSVEVDVVDLPKKGGSMCNPKLSKAKINFHSFGKGSCIVVTSGLPEYPVEIILDVEKMKYINEFLIKISE